MKSNQKPNYNLIIGLSVTGLIILLTLIGQFWTPYNPNEMNASLKNTAPSAAHLFGTDNLGRDVFSRVMNGAGMTFLVAVTTVLIGWFVGTIIGALTGFFGGWLDELIMRITDMLLAFPSILLALILISVIGPGEWNIIAALGILFIPSFARIVRSEVVRYKNQDFVKSAQLMGASRFRIIFVHIIPNTWVSMLTAATVGLNNAVLAEASMSYLGLGVQPPNPSLGRMLSESQGYLLNAPWSAIFPGVVIILTILGFSLVGEGLRRRS